MPRKPNRCDYQNFGKITYQYVPCTEWKIQCYYGPRKSRGEATDYAFSAHGRRFGTASTFGDPVARCVCLAALPL
jgi:hypothetical protein